MKYIRYQKNDDEYVGVLNGNIIYRLEYSSIMSAIENEEEISIKDKIQDDFNNVKILPPTDASKVVCVGLNYKDHADELEMNLPKEPLLFMKPSSSIIGFDDNIIYPNNTKKLDFEAELAIVILKETNSENADETSIAGYTILNDVTARDLQEKDGQWTRSKSFDTFCPIGPIVVTNIDSSNLKIKSKVNNQIKQDSNTKNMIFSPLDLVRYISSIMTLNPGDIIATGTPPGIDHLQKGDVVEIIIEKIGTLKNTVK